MKLDIYTIPLYTLYFLACIATVYACVVTFGWAWIIGYFIVSIVLGLLAQRHVLSA